MTGLGRWTLPPSALHVRWTGREKAIQGNFYSPTMRMQGISFTPFFFVCLFLNTMFPNEHLAFAQFVSGEHRPCWMPSGCRETHDHFREQLCQPLPRKPGPCSLRGTQAFLPRLWAGVTRALLVERSWAGGRGDTCPGPLPGAAPPVHLPLLGPQTPPSASLFSDTFSNGRN